MSFKAPTTSTEVNSPTWFSDRNRNSTSSWYSAASTLSTAEPWVTTTTPAATVTDIAVGVIPTEPGVMVSSDGETVTVVSDGATDCPCTTTKPAGVTVTVGPVRDMALL